MQKCPHCAAKLYVPEKKSGKQVTCPKCGQCFQAPIVATMATTSDRINVRCRKCFKLLSVKQHQVGQTRTCPRCRGTTWLKPSAKEPRACCSSCHKTFVYPGDMTGHLHACPMCLATIRLEEVSGKQVVSCDACQQSINIPAKLLGQTGRCSQCGSKTTFVAVASPPVEQESPIPIAIAVEDLDPNQSDS